MLKNPFLIYVLSFGAVLAVYELGWSEVYPSLSPGLLAFFGLTFLVSILLAFKVSDVVRDIKDYQPGQLPKYTVVLLLALFAADLVYTGGIPLLMLIGGRLQYGGELGVPHLHVFTVTFGAVFSTIRFCDYLYSKRWRYLFEALVPVAYMILIVYRGPAVICLITWGFALLIKRGRLGMLRSALIAVFTLAVLHVFGLFGDLREGPGYFDRIARPTAAFQNSAIPKTYLWTFIYMTAPMANLQLAVDTANLENRDAARFVVSEMLPDFISKRILPSMGTTRVKTPEVSPTLNVATMYGRSYVYMGWPGPVLMFMLLSALILGYLQLIRDSPYRVPCLALLNTFVVFCTFQNMIAYTGLFIQLIWPLLLGLRWFRSNRYPAVLRPETGSIQ
jgi:hypothetical protein